jgi:cytochrome c-type biogenesis protein
MGSISLIAAFAAGLLSFLNPCVLPLVPGFLGYLSGVSLSDPRSRLKVFINSLFFVLGFSFVFGILGVLLNSVLAATSQSLRVLLSRLGGIIIILFACHLLGIIRIPILEKEHRIALRTGLKPTYFLSFIFGAVFAVGWTPCVGALLGSVLTLAATSPGLSFILLMSYALGLGVPFLFVGFFSALAIKVISGSARFFKYFNIGVGFFVLALGILIFSGRLSSLVSPVSLNIRAGLAPAIVELPGISKDDTWQARLAMKKKKYKMANELIPNGGFINTGPFGLADFVRKKVILLDFWTYSCINCLRTFPYLKDWYSRYKDAGLEIIGVHSPEFEFEKKYDNVAAAVKKLGITFPVVLDNDHSNLSLYGTVYWPTKYLIDIDGFIVYKHIGEGGYREIELRIRELLAERKEVLGQGG